MMFNPYEPSQLEPEPRPALPKIARWILEPLPVRSSLEYPFQWLVDAMVGFILILAGLLIAGLISKWLPFLCSMAHPTGLVIGFLPFVLWLNYCQSKDFTFRSYLGLPPFVFGIWTLQGGFVDLLLVPAAIAITSVLLLFEFALVKLVLAVLPGSSAKTDEGY